MGSIKVLTLLIVFFVCGIFFVSHAQFIRHSYRFNGTFSASEPDCGPDMIQIKAGGNCGAGTNPGMFTSDTLPYCANRRTVYHTNLHWGVMYPNTTGSISTTYTIHMYVKNTSWRNGTWARIIDFSSTADNDVGMYYERVISNDRCLRFWPTGIVGRCPYFSLNTYYLLSFTRNGTTGIIDVYVNGILFTSYHDRQNNYVALPGKPVYIYRDDGGIYPCESGEANIAYLSFSNQYSLQPEISSVYNNICRIANINTADFTFSPATNCGTSQNTTVSYTGNIAPPGTDYTFKWDWDNATVVSGSGMGPFVVSWNTTGVKNVKLTITGGACTTPVTGNRAITVGSLNASATALPATCAGSNNGSVAISANGGAQPYQYSLDGINYQSLPAFSAPAGQYSVVVKDANNCTANTNVLVPLINDLTVHSLSDTSVCQGGSVKLLTIGNAASYLWQPASGLDNANSKDPVASPVITTDYIVTATSGSCTQKDTVRIVVQRLSVSVTPDTTVMPGMPFQLMAYFAQANVLPGVSYLWSPSAGLNNPNIANPTAVVQSDQLFRLEVTSPQGCKATATVVVKVLKEPDIHVPNAFTPNNDGRNDLLKPVGVGMQSLKYFKVFNRWGDIVYSSSAFNQGWDGRIRGADQPAGTFVWVLEGVTPLGKVIFKKGTVVLIR